MFENCEKFILENRNTSTEKIQNKFAISIDEVGRGPLFGPVTVGGVLYSLSKIEKFHDLELFHQVKDSKLLSIKKREFLYKEITSKKYNKDFMVDVSHVSVKYIDKNNINQAIKYATYRLVQKLIFKHNISISNLEFILFDGNYKFVYPDYLMSKKMPIIYTKKKGDKKCFTIAIASVIAKVIRDNMIKNSALKFSNYFLEKNMGYGTSQHREAIIQYGLTKFHRQTFCKKILLNNFIKK